MRPLRIRYSGAAFQDLIEMTDAEILSLFAYVISQDYATDGTNLQATVNIGGAGTSIGTFTDTWRTEPVNSPHAVNATGATSSTTYTFNQQLSAGSVSISNRAVGLNGTAVYEFTDAQYNTDIMDKIIGSVTAGSQVGQYQLKTTTPAGGTWVSRGTFTDTTDSAGGGSTTTWTLWQKTALASPPSTTANRPLKWNGSTGLQEMTDAEIKQSTMLFRNRIINNGVGQYRVQTSSPVGGTWVQQGDTVTDNIQVYTVVGGYFNVTSATTTGSGGTVGLWLRTA
jgi:hypothetical protein